MDKRTVRTWTATYGLIVPAVMALALSADTSFRFMGSRLMITNPVERGVLCGTAEASIVALCLYAWATETKGAAWLAYAAVLVQSVPAFEVSGGYGGMVRIALGPVLLAVLLHLLLGLELRMSRQKSSGLLAAVLREARERLTSYFGIGRRGEDSAAIARSRAADRAVALADQVAAVKPRSRRYTRRTAALADAIDRARHGLDAHGAQKAEDVIVSRVVRRKSVAALATIDVQHDWTQSVPVTRTRRTTVSEPVSADTDTAEADSVPDTDMDTKPVRRMSNGSMRTVALSMITDNPDVTDGDLTDALMDRFGPDTKANSVYVAIKRARRDWRQSA